MSTGSAAWTKEEDKAFENAIATHWDAPELEGKESEEMWEKIASMLPTKNMEDLKQHYQMLVEDVGAIEAGQVPIPNYASVGEETTNASTKDKDRHLHPHGATGSDTNKRPNSGFGSGFSGLSHDSSSHATKGGSRSEQERRKGIPWTEEEHRFVYFQRLRILGHFLESYIIYQFRSKKEKGVSGYLFFWSVRSGVAMESFSLLFSYRDFLS